MIRPLRNIAIEHKLRIMIAAVAVLTLLSAAGVFVPWAVDRFDVEKSGELRAMADGMGFSATFALNALEINEAERRQALEELRVVIEQMAMDRDVAAVAIYHLRPTGESERVVEYFPNGAPMALPVRAPPVGFDPEALSFTTDAKGEFENVAGRVYVRGDIKRKREFERRLWTAVAVALLSALVVTMFAGLVVQRAIVLPLRGLMITAKLVREEQDYSVRADVAGGDEIGRLGEGFNEMLDQIQRRDAELRRHQQTLESRVAKQTRELREANLKLITAKEKAEAANRTKGTFLANANHELRTPLNSIIGYGDILREELDEAGLVELRPDVDRIRRSGRNLLALVSDVLDLSKMEVGRMALSLERFDMVRLLNEVREDLQTLADARGNRIVFEPVEDRLFVWSDRTKVMRVANNLISNACKFTSRGMVTLTLVVDGFGSDERVVLRVADTGCGMNAEELELAFEPFQQVGQASDPELGGTGLGLPISRRLCQVMGGDLQAASEPGQGSVFTASFSKVVEKQEGPRTQASEARNDGLEPVGGARGRAPARNRRVLVVDDDDAARQLLCRHLERDGFEVISANSCEKGLRLAREATPDTITLDVSTPGMTGWEFSREMARDPKLARIPIVVVTMLEEAEEQYRDLAADFLLKPVAPGRLLRVIRRVTKC